MQPLQPSKPKPIGNRSRSGCWTCRTRKKKCDSLTVPCSTCVRLGLHCERNVRLVWEDDTRRAGMKRRGRQKPTEEVLSFHPNTTEDPISHQPTVSSSSAEPVMNPPCRALPLWPQDLNQAESRLLDHYIQRFSRTYPTFSGPTNPFLSVLLPLSAQNRTVLDALLALSGAQTWENGQFMYQDIMANLRQKSLRGCMNLVTRIMKDTRPQTTIDFNEYPSFGTDLALKILSGETDITQNQDFLLLLATCVLLILYEKLTSETGGRGSVHLQFLARVVPCQLVLAIISGSAACAVNHSQKEPLWFLSSLFLYNDLVQSTSLGIPTLSDFYRATIPEANQQLGKEVSPGPGDDRFYFPRVITRIGVGDVEVTDEDIRAWNGRLDWFPSYALYCPEPQHDDHRLPICDPVLVVHPEVKNINVFSSVCQWEEQNIVSELYRIAAMIYKKQCSTQRFTSNHSEKTPLCGNNELCMGNLPSWATQLIDSIPIGSPFENALLWPIGIVAKEIDEDHLEERKALVAKLAGLEQRLKQKNFYLVRQHLVRQWIGDHKWLAEQDGTILFG